MNERTRQLLFWLPRILGILFAAFISLFALDVFSEGYTFSETLIALFMHLIPTFLVVITLVIAWRREWVGAVVFAALGLFYIIAFWGPSHWSAYLVISGPLFVIALLFFISRKLHLGSKSV